MQVNEPFANIEVNAFIEDISIEWELVAPGVRRKIMTFDNKIMMVKVDFEKDAIGTLHHHYHTQLSYVASGSFEVEIDGIKKVLHQGDVFHAISNLIHGVVCIEKGLLIDVFNPMREDFLPVQ